MSDIDYRDSMGRYRTASLFKEAYNTNADQDKYPPVFTLGARDKDGLVSMKRVYLELEDPTGYAVSQQLLGSYAHWKKLCEASWFAEHLREWEEELEIKLQSRALLKVKEISLGDTAQAFQAAKFLNDKGWKAKKGRPTKAEKEAAVKKEAKLSDAVQGDLERIRAVK